MASDDIAEVPESQASQSVLGEGVVAPPRGVIRYMLPDICNKSKATTLSP